MASICLSVNTLSPSTSKSPAIPSTSSSYTSPSSSSSFCRCFLMPRPLFMPRWTAIMTNYRINRRAERQVVRMAPDEEKLTRRNPLDFPIEWERPKPGRRPDIFPQFSPMKTPLPPPLPYDPPEEDEEDEEKKEEEEDPEKEEPDQQESRWFPLRSW